ncbi:response regulator [Vibrio sp. SM6]|uniref:histidine kinase n=1 Tax=Vibrio agarilyticus TaxID=2726741 RepID=A0A7X8TTV6_9VIBR|nr:ATP-binding protein [Vibrio agarilyticus]NLS14721.1 response regulator [Vibrio agarilyticus]
MNNLHSSSLQKKLIINCLIPVFLMLGVYVSVLNHIKSVIHDDHWVNHTHQAISKAHELKYMILKIEPYMNSQLILNDKGIKDEFINATQNWNAKLNALTNLVDDNPSQVQLLLSIDDIYTYWVSTVLSSSSIQNNRTSSNFISKHNENQNKIKKINSELDRFIFEEEKLIKNRIVSAKNSKHSLYLVVGIGTTLAILVSVISTILFYRNINTRLRFLIYEIKSIISKQTKNALDNSPLMNNKKQRDEIQILTDHFIQMSIHLADKEQQEQEHKKNLEQARDNAEKANKAKGNFLSIMSHEIRTPMNGVLGLAKIIQNQTKENSTKGYAQTIIESGQHLVTILNDILDIAKVEENKLTLENTPFSVTQIINPVHSTLAPLAEEKNIDFFIENRVEDNTQFVGDASRIRQVIMNLAGNAVKFTHEGHIMISVTHNKPDGLLKFSVKDTGIGIKETSKAQIFRPFEQADTSTTREYGGTGLGLSIVEKLTEAMKGSIAVESQFGKGTEFILELPITSYQSHPQQTATALFDQPPTTPQPLQVLIAEDNAVNAFVAKCYCENLHCDVDIVTNGVEVLAKLNSGKHYDIILMDNHMPEMDGIEATHHVRRLLGEQILIFAYTADVFQDVHDKFNAAGADYILAKPLDESTLRNAIEQFKSRIYAAPTELIS